MEIKIKKLNSDAVIPRYAHEDDAGMDIFSCEDILIKSNHRAMIRTGISLEIPRGYVALVWDKSGLAKKGLTTLAGVMDSGYRGEYIILLHNIGSEDKKIRRGEKIAQILIQKVESPKVEIVEQLSESSRGSKGFGSSGLK